MAEKSAITILLVKIQGFSFLVERPQGHSASLGCLFCGQFFVFPEQIILLVVGRYFKWRSTEAHPSFLRRRNARCLTFSDIDALVLGNEGQKLVTQDQK